MNKVLQIALLLTAVDKMSDIAEKATSNVERNMKRIKGGYSEIMTGMAQAISGKMLIDNTVAPMTSAFNSVQDHSANLRIAMMKDGGSINEGYFGQMFKASEMLSEKFGENRNDYLDMFRILKSHHFNDGEILGGFGQEMANFSKLMEIAPTGATKFMAGLKMDLNLSTSEVTKMMDLVQRLHFGEGVGNNPQEAVDMLRESFSIASLGMTNLKYTGFNAARDFSAMLVPFLRRGLPGETLGTGFRKIYANMLDKDKMKEFDDVAATFGKHFEFFDKQGNFLGLENFMRQMDLFKGMSMPDVNSILMPLTGGKTGLSSDVFKILAQEGSEGFNAGMKSIYAQAEMHARLTERMKQQSVQQARLHEMWNNAKRDIGATLIPMVISLTHKMMGLVHAIKSFTSSHPHITATIFKLLGFVGAVLLLSGTFKMLKGAWMIVTGSLGLVSRLSGLSKLVSYLRWLTPAFGSATTGAIGFAGALLANPITWVVVGIGLLIAAVVLVVKHWDGFKHFWSALWHGCKSVFGSVINWMSHSLLRFTPFFLVYNHWRPLAAFFKSIWTLIKVIFHSAIQAIKDMLDGKLFYEAGGNMVRSIWKGIKDFAHMPIQAMKDMVQKIRNHLPFSPAKEGPLRDIHRIRLIETIAENIKPTALLEKMRSVSQAVFQYSPSGFVSNLATPNSSISGGGLVVHYAPTYQGRAGGSFASDKEDFMAFMSKNKREVVDVIQDEFLRRQSRSF